jgi:hypothetical protein
LAILFAICGAIGPLASCGLSVVLVLVGLHVAGNALGTSLRDEASQLSAANETTMQGEPFSVPVPVRLDGSHSVSRLSQRTPLGWVILASTFTGTVIGSWLGQWILVNSTTVPLRGILLGAVSSGVLGAFGGLLFGSFLNTWLGAWRQACAESDRCDKQHALQPSDSA